MKKDLRRYVGLDNRDLKARSELSWREQRIASLKHFIEVWEASNSVQEVAQKLRLPNRKVTWTATNLRKRHGVKLKKFPYPGRLPIDSSVLQDHLTQIRAAQPSTPKPPPHQP